MGLPPVVGPHARTLILGSFPSERSLETGEYYANRRNQFWPLLGAVFGFAADLPYRDRLAATTGHGVALWDVVHSCRRSGSMDHKIDRNSLVINDFGSLFGETAVLRAPGGLEALLDELAGLGLEPLDAGGHPPRKLRFRPVPRRLRR